ncbi:hypothetical protein AB0M46_38555 [Dactylosporangium sp. NPDC051485]|uniref:hypothetical protein n=1 Tax=Dactylosporangium sp. NPDC051485 TaxID=3154846 RepID=UPI0034373914
MLRSRALLAVTALALTASLSACGGNAPQEIKAPAPTTTGPLTEERRETLFLDATATHLCGIQSRVYTDPGAMASAYASRPIYADLTDAQVDAFRQRLISDPAFAARLTEKMKVVCGTAPSASSAG